MTSPAFRRSAGPASRRRVPSRARAFRPPRSRLPDGPSPASLVEAALHQPGTRARLHWQLLRHTRRHVGWHLRGMAREALAWLRRRPG